MQKTNSFTQYSRINKLFSEVGLIAMRKVVPRTYRIFCHPENELVEACVSGSPANMPEFMIVVVCHVFTSRHCNLGWAPASLTHTMFSLLPNFLRLFFVLV